MVSCVVEAFACGCYASSRLAYWLSKELRFEAARSGRSACIRAKTLSYARTCISMASGRQHMHDECAAGVAADVTASAFCSLLRCRRLLP